MDKREILELTSDFRNNIYINNINHKMTPVEFSQWGAGEYKIDYHVRDKYGRHVHLFIPYLTMTTLEKAIVFTRYAKKHGTGVSTLIGYVSYDRQERETLNEPELLSMSTLLIGQLSNVKIIEPHDLNSMREFQNLFPTVLLDSERPEDNFVVAPDKGAEKRNSDLGIESHIVIGKQRLGGEVKSHIERDVIDMREHDNTHPFKFVIYDDICDGGRTFLNVAQLLKAKYPNCSVTLYASHAILPFGTEHLKGHIDRIVTLNTCFPVGVHDNGFVKVYDVFELLQDFC